MGLKAKVKEWAKQGVEDAMKKEGDTAGSWSSRNLPTFKAGGAKLAAGGSAVGAAGMAIVGGTARVAHKGLLALRSHYTALFLVLCAAAHYFNVARGTIAFSFSDPMLLVYLVVLPVLAAFLFYKDDDEPFPWRNMLKFIPISLAAYAIPVGVVWAIDHGFISMMIGSLILFGAPGWIVFVFLNPGESKVTRFLAGLFFLAWTVVILVLIMEAGLGISGGTFVVPISPSDFISAASGIYNKLGTEFGAVYSQAKNTINGTIAGATQEYYTGTVDQSQGQPIGVFITRMQPALTKFYADNQDSVIVYGVLSARTVSDSISVANTCSLDFASGASTVSKPGSVTPDKINIDYTGAFQDQYDISCTVPYTSYSSALSPGRTSSAMATFSSTFDFSTWAYVPYAFMDRDLLVSLRRSNVDPAQKLGISAIPMAKFTPGPLMIGMASDSQPYSYQDGGSLPFFGLTLTNQWFGKGSVNKFNSVDVYIPKPFDLELDTCTPRDVSSGGAFDYRDAADWSQNPAYKHYQIFNVAIKPSETFTTIRCQIGYNDAELSQYPILGTSGAGVYTFFASANYTYTLQAKTPVTLVSPSVAMNSGGAGSTYQPTQQQLQMESECTQGANCNAGPCTCVVTLPGSSDVWHCQYTNNVRSRVCYRVVDAQKQTEQLCQFYTDRDPTCNTCTVQGYGYSCAS